MIRFGHDPMQIQDHDPKNNSSRDRNGSRSKLGLVTRINDPRH
jgi:hypothetical protein